MDKKQIITKLEQFYKTALNEHEQLQRRRRMFENDYNDDCNDCWYQGHEEASEPVDELIGNLAKLLREIHLDDVMNSEPVEVDERQIALF